jgi:amino acid adenylation domain-containing protein
MVFVHEAFELRARAAPTATAVRFKTERLSYGELNTRANQLSHQLQRLGIGRASRVVVCVQPGFDIVVALLAVFKAGAVYVPLDPGYPAARITAMLDDTNPALVVSSSALAAELPFGAWPTLELDTAASWLRELPAENPGLQLESQQSATVFYTSGTTGTPKGVVASQANVTSYVALAQARYGFSSADTGPAIARFSFSISIFELLSPLVAGGTLLVLEREQVLDLPRLAETLREVTFFHAGPSLLRSLLAYIKRHYDATQAFAGVRHASSGGDMVPVDVLQALREVFPRAELFVIYGCSEISCMGCTYPVPRDAPLLKSYVGKPFPGVSVEVVNDELEPVASGVVGEVLFAGPGVVQGYLNRPELTAQKFIERHGSRFYRTGDRGRFSEEGWLELLGRSDFQVQLRGMRVELGEIELQLRKAPGVNNGVVVARQQSDGEKALVAYVVADDEASGNGAERTTAIRDYLAQHLPDYMVPATFVELAALPLNHNMKIDRRALPDPPQFAQRPALGPKLREPETATERQLAELWKKNLRMERVGLDDNFFDLGGHSLLALQLILEVDRQLGVTLSGLDVLRESLEMQAQLCDRKRGRTATAARAVPANPSNEALELFHFGPENSLFGALHGTPGPASEHAVLICSPLGHEYVRAHFILQRLARQLGAAGIPALRFDYFGCRDSLGESHEATCSRWQQDIIAACHELQQRTHAARISAVGVRLGATLLARAASRLSLAKLVLWDPVRHGAAHKAELAELHRRYLRSASLVPFRLPSWRANGGQELLGSTYSAAALRELAALDLEPLASDPRYPVETVELGCAWQDLGHLEDMLPDVGISRALVQSVRERS